MKTTIGIPAFNEEKNIAKMIVKLKKISDEIIVCNDGSSDLTGEIAEKMGAIVINHEKNLGYGAGINSIIKKSKEIDNVQKYIADATIIKNIYIKNKLVNFITKK